jgi:hypothetical protein
MARSTADRPAQPALLRRRSVLKTVAMAATGSLSAPFVISARAADTLVVTAYGGEYQDVFMKSVIEPFEKKFGVQVTYDESGGAAQTYAKIRAARGFPFSIRLVIFFIAWAPPTAATYFATMSSAVGAGPAAGAVAPGVAGRGMGRASDSKTAGTATGRVLPR